MTISTATRFCLLVLAALSVAAVKAASVSDEGEGHGPDDAADDGSPIAHVSSTTSSIVVRWARNITSIGSCADDDVISSKTTSGSAAASTTLIRVQAVSLSTEMTLTSPPLDANFTRNFTLPDLAVDTVYRVCVVRQGNECACADMKTIPQVRLDSVLAVVLTIAFIILLVLLAVTCWRCAICCAARAEAANHEPPEDEEKTAATAGGPGEDEKSPLLVPGGGPGSSPNNDQGQPGSLYMFLAAPALDHK